MEGTSETKILIPLIVTICVACYVGGLFNEGIYEILIEMKGYLYLGATSIHLATWQADRIDEVQRLFLYYLDNNLAGLVIAASEWLAEDFLLRAAAPPLRAAAPPFRRLRRILYVL